MLMLPILLAATVMCPDLETTYLVGRWESQRTSKGGIGQVIDFKADGSYTSSVAVLVNVSYAIEGDRLRIIDPQNPTTVPAEGVKFRIEGEKFVRTHSNGSEVVAVRIPSSDAQANSIIGGWSYSHDAGGIAYERYTSDHRLIFRLPITSSVGCYIPDSVKGTMLLAPLHGKETTTTIRMEGQGLELLQEGKDPHVYRKSEWGGWYSLEGAGKEK